MRDSTSSHRARQPAQDQSTPVCVRRTILLAHSTDVARGCTLTCAATARLAASMLGLKSSGAEEGAPLLRRGPLRASPHATPARQLKLKRERTAHGTSASRGASLQNPSCSCGHGNVSCGHTHSCSLALSPGSGSGSRFSRPNTATRSSSTDRTVSQ